jgi:hypothetical protein
VIKLADKIFFSNHIADENIQIGREMPRLIDKAAKHISFLLRHRASQ